MWARPNIIPGSQINPIHRARDIKCPKCHRNLREVEQKTDDKGKVFTECPYCGKKISLKKDEQ